MNPKKIFIAIIKNLIVLVIATLIFSSITLDFPNLLKGFFGDIFERSATLAALLEPFRAVLRRTLDFAARAFQAHASIGTGETLERGRNMEKPHGPHLPLRNPAHPQRRELVCASSARVVSQNFQCWNVWN